MPGFQLHDKLLDLPLFQGMSNADLSVIIGQTKFGFHKFQGGKTVIKEYDACDTLFFLMKGSLTVETYADDHGYRLIEEVHAPAVLQPELMFGLHQYYNRTYSARTECQFITLDKNEVMRLLDEFIIFRLNFLNILSTQCQKLSRRLWRTPPASLSLRIAEFIRSRCLLPTGGKTLYIKMTRLADELNDSRLDISRALNTMQSSNLLELHRGRVHIPALEHLPR